MHASDRALVAALAHGTGNGVDDCAAQPVRQQTSASTATRANTLASMVLAIFVVGAARGGVLLSSWGGRQCYFCHDPLIASFYSRHGRSPLVATHCLEWQERKGFGKKTHRSRRPIDARVIFCFFFLAPPRPSRVSPCTWQKGGGG